MASSVGFELLNVVLASAAEQRRKTRVGAQIVVEQLAPAKSSQMEVKQASGETDCRFLLGGPTLKKQTVVGCQWR